ncbi:MAG TPA: PLP-dependent aminotransferase family protein [Pyrinomonadaceae bacterium]|nr:PLP-dependent aminotransferase family protein [Pyrinomonadaceae bacterium]
MEKQRTLVPFVSLAGRAQTDVPMYRQIYDEFRRGILSGKISPRSRIPSSRALADQLGVSRITVVNAYDQLFAEGYLEARVGSGTFVAGELPEELLHTASLRNLKKPRVSRPLSLSAKGTQAARDSARIVSEQSANKFIPFQNGLTALDSFPFDVWARIAARCIRYISPGDMFDGDLTGYRLLREAIATHLGSARGVRCDPEQVIVTAGTQQALSLISAVLLEADDEVWMEDPGYTSARSLFIHSRTNLVSVPVDNDGLDVNAASAVGKNPKLIYVTPSHQYPLGVTMSVARRLSLIETARSTGAWIIEDDYDSEYRYAGRPIASLQGLDDEGRVLYVGTFSKTIFPSLKLGCLVVPPDLVDVFTATRVLTGSQPPLIDQAILAEFISEGHFARHVRRMRTLYAERQRSLVEQVDRRLKGLVEMKADDAGMHLVGWLPGDLDDREVVRKAAEANIRLNSISDHCIAPYPRNGLVFGYAAFDEKKIKRGVVKIAAVLEKMA